LILGNIILTAFSWVFRIAVNLRLLAYKYGVLPVRKVETRVVCVGNITMGGSGKTSVVIEVVRRLQDAGKNAVIISRGYRRRKEEEIRIVSDGKTIFLGSDEGGDEPVMLSERCKGAPVIVGGDRYAAAKLAMTRFEPDVIVMDDGFQHVALWRDIDLLVFDGTQDIQMLKMFPAGTLREPVKAMRRAKAAIVTKLNLTDDTQDVPGEIRSIAPELKIFHCSLEPVVLTNIHREELETNVSELADRKIIAVCGIGNSAAFERLLSDALGMLICRRFFFRDHHRYTDTDVEMIEGSRRSLGAEWVITTEKDAVKIEKATREPAVWRAVRTEVRLRPGDSDEFDAMLGDLFTNKMRIGY